MADKFETEPPAGVQLKRLQAVFYRTGPSGNAPVRDWLKNDVEAIDRRTIGADIATVEFGWPVGMPTCRALGNGLWEVRSQISSGRIARVIFSISGYRMVLLHGFIKKSAQTPKADLELARKRQKR